MMIQNKIKIDVPQEENLQEFKNDFRERFNTRISKKTKLRWDNFIITHHDTLKGSYGPELERALNYYMDNFDSASTVETSKKINKSTLKTLKMISFGLKEIPTYPLTKPANLRDMIRNYCQYSDSRTVAKYQNKVVRYSKEVHVPGDMFPQLDVEGFCNYVSRLSNESHLK